MQVSNLTETVKLQSSPRASSSPSKQLQVVQARNQSLADELSTCKSEKNWLHEQLGVSHACSQKAAEENGKLKAQIKLLQARAADEHPDQF